MNIAIIAIGLLILSVVLYKKPAVGIIIAILIATTGELGRLPESTGLPYLANDLFLPFFAAIWILKKISFDRKYKIPQLLPPILLWTVIAGFSLLLNSSWLESSQLKESALYLVRFVEYFFLYLITVDESKSKQSKSILIALITGAVLISIFGFVQLELYPSFYHLNMMQEGWDPHINRLLSTWFDPNFVGGLLGFIICILFGLTIGDKEITKKPKKIIAILIPTLIILPALYLTYSRSAYLACGIGLMVITAIRSRQLLLLGGGLLAILFVTMGQAQDRLMDLWESFQSFLGVNEYAKLFNTDATSRLRIESWVDAIAVIKEHFWFGSGYNSYKYAQWNLGLISDIDLHHSTGSDSTLLNIFATTGIFGIATYVWFYAKTGINALKQATPYDLGLLGGLIAVLAHATFVNSLLFPHILIFFWISLGLSGKIRQSNS